MNEGVTLENVKEIHILDVHYNLGKVDQVIGRGIRRDSHIDLPLEERNCEIFQYASIIPPSFDKNL